MTDRRRQYVSSRGSYGVVLYTFYRKAADDNKRLRRCLPANLSSVLPSCLRTCGWRYSVTSFCTPTLAWDMLPVFGFCCLLLAGTYLPRNAYFLTILPHLPAHSRSFCVLPDSFCLFWFFWAGIRKEKERKGREATISFFFFFSPYSMDVERQDHHTHYAYLLHLPYLVVILSKFV